jgi:hypothetical protein
MVMKRVLFAVAAAVAALSSAGRAEAAGPMNGVIAPGVYSAAPMDGVESRYGVLPWLRKGFFFKQTGGCAGCGVAAAPGAGVPGYPQPGQPGMGMPGTLAFPNHPFARSPRDFFMYEK